MTLEKKTLPNRKGNENFNIERTCIADEEQMHDENMLLKTLDLSQ